MFINTLNEKNIYKNLDKMCLKLIESFTNWTTKRI